MAKTIQEVLVELQAQAQVAQSSGTISPSNYECEKCKDKGFWTEIRQADVFGDGRIIRDEEVWVTCPCQTQKKVNRLMKSSEITEEFQKLSFQNFDTTGRAEVIGKMKETAINYVRNFKEIRETRNNSIALIGQPGTGKTHLLSSVANGMMKNWFVAVHYFPYVEGMEDLKASFGDDKTSVSTKLQRLKEVDVLFIDDLFKPTRGVPRATEWQVEKIFEIINYRYLNNKPILVSSELTFDEMFAIDEALATRIFEMCSDYVVTVNKNTKLNYRLRKMFGEG